MIATKTLQIADSKSKTNNKIKNSSIDTFYKNYAKLTTVAHWLKTRAPFAYKILSRLGITPVSGASVNACSQLIYSIDDIANYFSIPDRENPDTPVQKPQPTLINISDLWKKYDINSRSFGRLFLNSGFTDPIRIGVTTYLSQDDVSKVEEILEKYCTFSQADRYLGHKHTRNLTKRNKLLLAHPLKGYSNCSMIDKIQLQNFATEHGFV